MRLRQLLQQLKGFKKIIFNFFWIAFDKVLRMLGGLIVGIWFARYLGPADFGAWNYALSIISLAIPLVNLGLNNILLTDLSRDSFGGIKIFNALIIKLLSGSLITLFIYLFSNTLGNEPVTKTLLIILSFQCIFQAFDVFDIFYQARTESKNSVIAKSCAYIVMNILKVIALLNNYSISVFGILTVLEVVAASSILLVLYFRKSKQSINSWKINLPIMRGLLIRSYPLIMGEFIIIIYMRLDQVMIKGLLGNDALGRYSAAVRLSEIWYFIGVAVTTSIYPSLIRLKGKSEVLYRNGFQKLFNILTTISIALAVVITLIAEPLILNLYGTQYEGVGIILAIHVWTSVFVFLGVGSTNWLMVENLQHFLIVRTLVAVGVNVVLNTILIPSYGGPGAAFATLVSQAFGSLFANALSSKTKDVFVLQLKSFLVILKPSIKNYIS